MTQESSAFRYPATRERVREGTVEHDALDQFVIEARRRPGKELRVRVDEAVPPQVEDRLATRDVLVRRAVRAVDGRPAAIETSYYPRDLTSGTELEDPADISRGTIQVLAELGHAQTGYLDEVAAHTLSAREAADLETPEAAPALRLVRTAWSGERVLRVTITVTPLGGGMVLCYEIGGPAPAGAAV
ncbi:MAG: UTRA domain-containing protein [Nocardiopsaceae bacterium]|nr:UTRA domain-containing protein [Nocardiopsaceae bacterium]